jgi:hypothetical protein
MVRKRSEPNQHFLVPECWRTKTDGFGRIAAGGRADRIAVRISFNMLRAGSETRAKYSSTFFGTLLRFLPEMALRDFTFFIVGSPRVQALRRHSGASLRWLLRRSQRDQGCADDNQYTRPDQFTACDQISDCLERHNGGVGKARP